VPEPLIEPTPTQTRTGSEPVEPTGEVARKNLRLAIALVTIALLFAAGAVAVTFIYLHYD
jgi:hypothetical protein